MGGRVEIPGRAGPALSGGARVHVTSCQSRMHALSSTVIVFTVTTTIMLDH